MTNQARSLPAGYFAWWFPHAGGAAGAGAALAACTPAAEGPHGTGRVQLVYQDWRTDWFPGLAQRMLEQFHALNPTTQVFFTMDPENLGDAMIADFQAGTAPDVLDGCCDFFPEWAQQGYLLDLRPFVQADLDRSTLDDWDPAQYQALFTSDGRQFGLPKYHGALALFYNKDIFDEASVPYPDGTWTHDDYLEAMKRLVRDRDGDGRNDIWAACSISLTGSRCTSTAGADTSSIRKTRASRGWPGARRWRRWSGSGRACGMTA
jgi:multiple sugar transport system substrate-binding protein